MARLPGLEYQRLKNQRNRQLPSRKACRRSTVDRFFQATAMYTAARSATALHFSRLLKAVVGLTMGLAVTSANANTSPFASSNSNRLCTRALPPSPVLDAAHNEQCIVDGEPHQVRHQRRGRTATGGETGVITSWLKPPR